MSEELKRRFSVKINTVIDKFFKPKKLNNFQKNTEYERGLQLGQALNNRNIDEAREVIMRETICGNFDCLKGLNKALSRDLAKKAYKML